MAHPTKLDLLSNQLALLQRQYKEVVKAERSDAENDYLETSKTYEALSRKLGQLELKKNAAKKRWENAIKDCRQTKKKILLEQSEINKLRKKLKMEPIEFSPEEPVSKKLKIFPKDKFEDPEL